MKINIHNQQLAQLYNPDEPNLNPTFIATGALPPEDYIKSTYVDPLFQPVDPSKSVDIKDVTDPSNVQDIDIDTISNALSDLWSGNNIDTTLDNQLSEIYRQSLYNNIQNDWLIERQMGVETLSKLKWGLPGYHNGTVVKFTANNDLIPTSKGLFAQPSAQTITEWFGALTGYVHNFSDIQNTLFLSVKNNDVFKRMQNFIQQAFNQHMQSVTPDDRNAVTDFLQISIADDILTGVFFPTSDNINMYSFKHFIMSGLYDELSNTNPEMWVQPIDFKQSVHPTNLVVINIENLMHSTSIEVKNEFKSLEHAFKMVNYAPNLSMRKLLTSKRVAQHTTQGNQHQQSGDIVRVKNTPFSKKPVTTTKLLKMMTRAMNRETTALQTSNTYKTIKHSYNRANRRQPDNPNVPGKIVTTKYRPDIHIYLDTSGSISESNYHDAVMNLIRVAKKNNVNMYFTSFSHVISQPVLLKTQNKTVKEIYKQFIGAPKVSGGTNFSNVWHRIDELDDLHNKQNKSHHINFIITDFEYSLNRSQQFNPNKASAKYTYYVPISEDATYWKYLSRNAEDLSKQIYRAGYKGIRNKMLL